MVYEKHEYTTWENARLQAWGCEEQVFYNFKKIQYDWLAIIVYLMNRIS